MAYDCLLYDVADGVATVTLNRPKQLNSLNAQLRVEITEAVLRAPGDGARALVMTGAGRGFCSGHDISSDGDMTELDLGEMLRHEFDPMLKAIAHCTIPTIAAVNGVAAGAGASLAFCCDMIFAARSVTFSQVFARIGLIPAAGNSYFLPRLMGLPRAMGMCLTGEPLPAEEAERIGMIWRAVVDEALMETVAAQASKLAKGPTLAYRLTKEALRQSLDHSFETQLEVEAALQAQAGRSEDCAEGLAAFAEKRKPVYKGR